MGEKERSAAAAEDPGVVRDLNQSPSGAQAGSGATHEDDWGGHTSGRVATADVDGDGVEDSTASAPSTVERQTLGHSFGDRAGAGGASEDDAGGGAPDPATTIVKSRSNTKNN